MANGSELAPIERRADLSAEEFFRSYVGKRPVVLAGLVANWPAVTSWTPEYWISKWGRSPVKVKRGNVADSDYVEMSMGDYVQAIHATQAPSPDIYLHNFPLLHTYARLLRDVQPFPTRYLPNWYRDDWWRPMQFFYGPTDSRTPLHFDGYGTHGFLFQVTGSKRIIFIDPRDRSRCAMTKFFWSVIDAENPDLAAYPDFASVARRECVTRPGDLVYWPPWTLHQVRNLEPSSSFSLEWHDRRSVARSLAVIDNQHPMRMLRLNVAHALGLWCKIPKRLTYPAYRFYFDSPRKRVTGVPDLAHGGSPISSATSVRPTPR
jgi:ribosomal protein L16 Arg81 hydroxylase